MGRVEEVSVCVFYVCEHACVRDSSRVATRQARRRPSKLRRRRANHARVSTDRPALTRTHHLRRLFSDRPI